MNPVQVFYNNPYFENLKETKPFSDYLKMEEEKLRKNVSRGRVLDIGCGNGRSTAILQEISDEVVGIDFSERLLDQARKRLSGKSNVRFYLEDAKSTHFEDSTFDYVVMLWNTFGNLYSARDRVLCEAKRLLRPTGKIFLSVLSDRVIPEYMEMLRNNKLVVEHQDENYIFLREGLISERFSKQKLEAILSKAGLTGQIKTLTDISLWCEAKKKKLT